MDKKYKIISPTILTYSRLVLIPIIIALTLLELYIPTIILIVIGFITDYLDNFLAKLWHTESMTNGVLDIIISKTFELVLLFITKMYLVLLIDIIFIAINLVFYYKNKKIKILEIGYFKEILFIMLILFSFINQYMTNISFINGFIYMCVNIELLSLIDYLIYNINYKKLNINDNKMHKQLMVNLDELNKDIEFSNSELEEETKKEI